MSNDVNDGTTGGSEGSGADGGRGAAAESGAGIEADNTQADKTAQRETGAPTVAVPAAMTRLWTQPAFEPSRHPWKSYLQLPGINRLLLAGSMGLFAIALLQTLGPSVAASLRAAVHPYTAEGKQEICATRIHSVALALAAYAQDNDSRFPPLDYSTVDSKAQPQRMTWVSLVHDRPEAQSVAGSFDCPVGPGRPRGQEKLLSSYVINPVLCTAKVAEMDDAAATLMLADGGLKHDVSLLPPYPSWPSFGARKPDGSFNDGECNVDFRHNGLASVVYADGHADVLSPGAWSLDSTSWGGSAVVRRARTRIAGSSPQAQEFMARLQAGDIKGAASYLTAYRKALTPVSRQFVDLWRTNTGTHTSDSVEGIGWHLARAWQQAGDASWRTQLDTLERQRCLEELERTNSGGWDTRNSEAGWMTYQAPTNWVSSEEHEGRYKRTYVRAGIRGVFMVLESAERSSFSATRPIDWGGTEKDFRARYGAAGYKRLQMTEGKLLGWPAGVWEYEVEKPGSPRLRKFYVGYVEGSNSRVVTWTAPAKDWELWKPIFDQLYKGIESR